MKRVLLLILVMLNLFQHLAIAQTNVYHPFPKWDSNPLWRERTYSTQQQNPIIKNAQYQLTGDTVIGVYTYQKLLYTGYFNNDSSELAFWYNEGVIRDDTLARKVYILRYGDEETLLYDFTLEIGDTLLGNWEQNYPTLIVTDVDSILIGNEYRKRIRFTDTDIIEGIGSTQGLLACHYNPHYYNHLQCFSQNGESLYPNSSSVCNAIILNIEEPISNYFTLYPNPATSSITIESVVGSPWSEVKIFNAQGQVVCTTPFPLLVQGGGDRRSGVVDISALAPGIYFLSLQTEQGTVSKKFVKE